MKEKKEEYKDLCVIKKYDVKNFLSIILIVLFPIVLFLAMEFLNGTRLNSVNTAFNGEKRLSLIIITILSIGTYGITGKIKTSMIVSAVIGMILAVINYLLVQIRGTSITPTDFYSTGMVYGMINSIKINLSAEVFISIGLIVLWIFMFSKIKVKGISKNKKMICRITSISVCVAFFTLFLKTDVFSVNLTYNTKQFYEQRGVATSFLTTLKNMKLKEPDGYSKEVIKQYLKENKTKRTIKKDKKNPNIIVIMNESLSDLVNLYNLEISEDNMPFIHSLKENTVKAHVHSSSLGGKTANCEWEFLTGNTSRFLPVGAVTYQLYIKQHVISIVDILNSKGYYTTAFHPYKAEGYNRNVVYPLMGFKECKFEDNLEGLNYLRYDFVDDLSTYKNIIKLFEEKDKNQKIFNFTITMQNHLSYNDRSFINNVYLKDFNDEEHFDVNQYLSLVKKSDEAFKYIVNYFKNYKEPTIIMMFGDHQPNLVENYPDVFGENTKGYNKENYVVPMVLWANYNIKEKNLGDISMNYLSNILLENAGIEKNRYMDFLERIYKKYPVITTNIYKDAKGNFNNYDNIPEELKMYEYMQYNNMFDDEIINDLYE